MSDESLALALIIASATASQLLAARARIPAIVPLLAAGVLLGPHVVDAIDPDELLGDLVEPIVSLAVGVILFEGSLALRREQLGQGVGPVVARLVTVGVLLTWAGATAGVALLLGIDFRIAILLGAVLTLSGPTVVLPLLDFVRPKPRIGTVLRWEGILIDPVGAIIAVLTFHAILSGGGEFHPGQFFATVGVGIGCGLVGGVLLSPILRSPRYTHALKSATTLGLVLTAVAAASAIRDDAGLVAAIAMGVALAHSSQGIVEETKVFAETLVGILIGALFVILAARVDPGDVVDLGLGGLALIALLVLIVRPVAIAACTAGSRLELRERAFAAWMMPRGIVAAATVSTFEPDLLAAGIPDADVLVPATFLVIAATVVIYGLTAKPVAAVLEVD